MCQNTWHLNINESYPRSESRKCILILSFENLGQHSWEFWIWYPFSFSAAFFFFFFFSHWKDGAVKHVGQMLCMRKKTERNTTVQWNVIGKGYNRIQYGYFSRTSQPSVASILGATDLTACLSYLNLFSVIRKSVFRNRRLFSMQWEKWKVQTRLPMC